jgi:hypothetical protein
MSDLLVADHQSIWLLMGVTEKGDAWIEDHIHQDEETQTWGGAIVVEPRYIGAIVKGAVKDGLTVSGISHFRPME